MSPRQGRAHHSGRVALFLMLACSIAIATVNPAVPDNATMIQTPGTNFNVTWHPFAGAEMVRDYAVSPTPVTIFRAELNETTLPGPRYMAFGPSIIGLAIDPRLLTVLFAAVFAGFIAWSVSFRKRGGGEDNHGKEE
jgi:hypothetical protein